MTDAQTIPVTKAELLEVLNHPEGYMRYAGDFFRGALGDLSEMITDELQNSIYSFEDTEMPDGSLQIKYVHPDFAGLPVKSITFSADHQSVRVSEGLAPAGSPLFVMIRDFVNPPPAVTGAGAAGAPMGGGRHHRGRRQQRKTKRRQHKHKSRRRHQRKTKSRRQ